jgi:hypothetical protein
MMVPSFKEVNGFGEIFKIVKREKCLTAKENLLFQMTGFLFRAITINIIKMNVCNCNHNPSLIDKGLFKISLHGKILNLLQLTIIIGMQDSLRLSYLIRISDEFSVINSCTG